MERTTTGSERNLFALDVRVEHALPGELVEVSGPLSVRTSEIVRAQLAQAIERGRGDLFVNLDGAEVYDATGLGVLMGAHHKASRAGRRLVVTDASPRLRRLLRAIKLDRVIGGDLRLTTGSALAS